MHQLTVVALPYTWRCCHLGTQIRCSSNRLSLQREWLSTSSWKYAPVMVIQPGMVHPVTGGRSWGQVNPRYSKYINRYRWAVFTLQGFLEDQTAQGFPRPSCPKENSKSPRLALLFSEVATQKKQPPNWPARWREEPGVLTPLVGLFPWVRHLQGILESDATSSGL